MISTGPCAHIPDRTISDTLQSFKHHELLSLPQPERYVDQCIVFVNFYRLAIRDQTTIYSMIDQVRCYALFDLVNYGPFQVVQAPVSGIRPGCRLRIPMRKCSIVAGFRILAPRIIPRSGLSSRKRAPASSES